MYGDFHSVLLNMDSGPVPAATSNPVSGSHWLDASEGDIINITRLQKKIRAII